MRASAPFLFLPNLIDPFLLLVVVTHQYKIFFLSLARRSPPLSNTVLCSWTKTICCVLDFVTEDAAAAAAAAFGTITS